MLGFPPHTTHRLQPLGFAVFGPLKTYYSQSCNTFMVNNPGRVINYRDIGKLFNETYNRAATVGNAIKGFSACGIEPINSNIFQIMILLLQKLQEGYLMKSRLYLDQVGQLNIFSQQNYQLCQWQ